jgi:hypothetical protein
LGFGAVTGGISGGIAAGSAAIQANTSALQQQMGQSLNTMSQTLRNMGASQSTINAVQNRITSGMAQAGYNQANVLAAVSALEAAGMPITEAAINEYINQNFGNHVRTRQDSIEDVSCTHSYCSYSFGSCVGICFGV